MRYKSDWEAWSPSKVTLGDGETWTFDLKKPEEGLNLAGGECGPIDAAIFLGHENLIKAKLRKKAEKLRLYLLALLSVVHQAAKAYHVERLAFRVMKMTARARAQYFLRVFGPEITEEASRIVDDAVMSAEVALLGWTEQEVAQARGQACLSFEHGGHDM